MTLPRLREEVGSLLQRELHWEGPLPAGELGQHLDSMQRMSLVVAIEDHFRICFEPEDEQDIRSFDDLLRCIAAKLEPGR